MYTVSSSPHIHDGDTTQRIMLDVVIALIPAGIFSVWHFGLRALAIMVITTLSCVAGEAVWQFLTKQKITVFDFSAVITGLLLAYNLPHTVPFWLPVVGGLFAIIIVKQFFGGLGQNFMNPALAARAVLLTSWAGAMTNFSMDAISGASQMVDTVATVTPLTALSLGSTDLPTLWEAFVGTIGGSLGETSALWLMVGGIYLIYRKVITWKIPVIYIGTVFVLTYLFGGNGLAEILYGGLFLGAIFMATDYSTTPMTGKGHIIFALGCGVLTVIIRKLGGYPEGVSYAIILMNLVVPIIDRYTKPRVFGEVAKSE